MIKTDSPEWRYIVQVIEARISKLLERLVSDKSEIETANIRGAIRELRSLLKEPNADRTPALSTKGLTSD
jgi:hypothetical protein